MLNPHEKRLINVGEVREVSELMEAMLDLDRRTDPERVQAALDETVTKELNRFVTPAGVDLAPAEMFQKVHDTLAARHDEAVAQDGVRLSRDWKATEADLERRIVASRQVTAKPDDHHELVLYRRLEGRTLKQLVDRYDRDGEADLLFTSLVETEGGSDLKRTFRLVDGPDDSEQITRLERIRMARQDARQDAKLTERLRIMREFRQTSLRLNDVLGRALHGDRIEIARLRMSRQKVQA